jgi:nitrogen fixation NifU-like protein
MESILKEVLLDHVKSPKNLGGLENPTFSANSNNPVCGDVVKIDLQIANDRIEAVGTSGQGCAISQASMSIFSEEIKKDTVSNVEKKIKEFKKLFDVDNSDALMLLSEESKLLKFLENNPSKVRCAMLSWLAVEDELSKN